MPVTRNYGVQFESAIGGFVEKRRKALELSRSGVVKRLGFKNLSKGCKRYDAFLGGHIEQPFILQNLAAALDVDVDVIQATLETTRCAISDAEKQAEADAEAAWRRSFRPHGIIETEKSIPEPIFIAALMGTEKLKRIELDDTAQDAALLEQMIVRTRDHMAEWNGSIPAFGKATGIVVNYTPDKAVRYDLEGNFRERLTSAVRLGSARIRFR